MPISHGMHTSLENIGIEHRVRLHREEWLLNGQLHKEDGPAIIWENGGQEWYLYGVRHRGNDLPALIIVGQKKEWWFNGQLHRENGPAIIYDYGREKWYTHGMRHRRDGPAVRYEFGGEEWWFDDQLHRENGPAVTTHDGIQMWYNHSQMHRLDGPAIIYPDGRVEWWVNGYNIKQNVITCPICRQINNETISIISTDKCVICWDNCVNIQLNLCQHQCMCRECCERLTITQ